jgi:hypothetical protein
VNRSKDGFSYFSIFELSSAVLPIERVGANAVYMNLCKVKLMIRTSLAEIEA